MPKQFARLTGKLTMLQETIRRLEDAGCAAPIFVTNEEYRFIVAAQAAELGLEGHRIVIEPAARNSAPAICAAAEIIAREDPNALILVAPADHLVRDGLAFAEAVSRGVERAREEAIVTFGIRPDRPETGYGYIELDARSAAGDAVQRFPRFVEKPDAETAQVMVDSGHFLWNSGLFLFAAETVSKAFGQFAPKVRGSVRRALREAREDLDFIRLGDSFASAPSIAFDHAVMEKIDGWVVPMQAGWSDLGSWRNLWVEAEKDEHGVAKAGAALNLGCEDTLLYSNDDTLQVVGVGLKNIAAIATRDAVLVADLDDTQAVTQAVAQLRLAGAQQADEFPRCERPWGHYESLALGTRFQVKSIVVKPGGKLSLQSHVHRAEHWIVVEGTATVTIGSEEKLLSENQSVYIPLGEIHRLANHGKVPLRLIEVQTGAYLGEDDIVRYEDVYARA
jgi:mannose-1-phosphate guanylyltransferase/mannose-1-phosphate guanylyltransferase/mannose-6-phosphate isomerase